jgi:RHS repeat-associated protein
LKVNGLTNPKYSPTKTTRRNFGMVNNALRKRLYYRKKPNNFTGKELDAETGLYYYGARYLDPKTSRWLSGDPAMGEYLPVAPVNDEAKKRNQNLPGQGGVFNYVNLHAYHYAGNNPVKYVDPDGEVATYSIDDENKTVTINLDIVIYGKDASASLAQDYKDRIMEQWGQDSNGNSWQMSIGDNQYTVNFNVNVTAGEKPGFFKNLWNAFFGTKNYINVDNRCKRPYVALGAMGTWITGGTPQRNNLSFTTDNIPAHEAGHLLGFKDRYKDVSPKKSVPHKGWEYNIMAATDKRVEQRNIDAIGGYLSGRKESGTLRSFFMRY